VFHQGSAPSLSPTVYSRPKHQLSPGHERNYQLVPGDSFETGFAQRMVLIEEDRNDVRVGEQYAHLASARNAGF
jgi:hypothetical protein